jgi:chemotaxis response regulator CheB
MTFFIHKCGEIIFAASAENGDGIHNGRALLAHGNHHLLVQGSPSGYVQRSKKGL